MYRLSSLHLQRMARGRGFEHEDTVETDSSRRTCQPVLDMRERVISTGLKVTYDTTHRRSLLTIRTSFRRSTPSAARKLVLIDVNIAPIIILFALLSIANVPVFPNAQGSASSTRHRPEAPVRSHRVVGRNRKIVGVDGGD
jgi:hypothetical protein